jgi:hypothetical protein
MEALKAAEDGHLANPSLADNAPEKAVKKIMVGNQLVATVYEAGVVEIVSPFDAKLRNLDLPNAHSSQLPTIRAKR